MVRVFRGNRFFEKKHFNYDRIKHAKVAKKKTCLQDVVIHYNHSVPPRNKKKEKSNSRELKLFVILSDLK